MIRLACSRPDAESGQPGFVKHPEGEGASRNDK